MNADVILIAYGEPPEPKFFDQWNYSSCILRKLTRLVAPIPKFMIPLIGAWRGYTRVKHWKQYHYSSPLETITKSQAAKVWDRLKELAPNVNWRVHTAFEFRAPSLSSVLERIPAFECDRLILIPMYVARSDFTTAFSVNEFHQFKKRTEKTFPPVDFVLFGSHLDDLAKVMARHIHAEAERLDLSPLDLKESALLMGCHGTLKRPPKGITETGYRETFDLYQVLERELASAFQVIRIGWLNHRLGGEWTSPTLADSIQEIKTMGVERILYYPFGFLADNAETQLEGRIAMEKAGISSYYHLPCVNDDSEFIDLLANLILQCGEENES